MTHYSFRRQAFREVIAHGGEGVVRTSRVADADRHQGFNFIDLTEIPPGHSIGLHRHGMHDEEVYVVVTGCGEMTVNDERTTVYPGDLIVNPAGGVHGLSNTGSETMRIVVLDVPV